MRFRSNSHISIVPTDGLRILLTTRTTMFPTTFLLLYTLRCSLASAQCPDYLTYASQPHEPFSTGKYRLPYQRPSANCRTFTSQLVESTITRVQSVITDPDLSRLFQNTYSNTLDTAIKWRGVSASNPDEELTFVITGDIDAMWLRDSANQMQSYLPILSMEEKEEGRGKNSIASLYRGVINLQARYLTTAPYCNSFQPPIESGLSPNFQKDRNDIVFPSYDPSKVFECKFELDSLAAFLQISAEYYNATQDLAFFSRFRWVDAVEAMLRVTFEMRTPTYGDDGRILPSPYTWTRSTRRATETLANDGVGNPVAKGVAMVRSAFRPSDDATAYQYFVPGNMMFQSYLASTAKIMAQLDDARAEGLTQRMEELAASIRRGIEAYATVEHPKFGTVYAYEVDGFGSTAVMDDANLPSLLSAPLLGFPINHTIYANTRKLILSGGNPYYMRGPRLSAVGGPHIGPGQAWPMASIVRILTSEDEQEVFGELKQLLSSTDGLGLMHESVSSWEEGRWTRQWFSWANGLFGQMILDLEERMPKVLGRSFQ